MTCTNVSIKLQIDTRDCRYPIFIGSGLITKLSKLLNSSSIKFTKCLLVIDSKVPKKIMIQVKNSIKNFDNLYIKLNTNEKIKNFKIVNKLIDILLKITFF